MEQMKKLSKKLIVLLTCVLLVATGLLLTGCNNDGENPNGSEQGGVTGENTTYTISVKSSGGMAMENLDIYWIHLLFQQGQSIFFKI